MSGEFSFEPDAEALAAALRRLARDAYRARRDPAGAMAADVAGRAAALRRSLRNRPPSDMARWLAALEDRAEGPESDESPARPGPAPCLSR